MVIRLENAGAKNPLNWASSEVSEGIPQFGRFLLLKTLFDLAKSTKDIIAIGADFDDSLDQKYNEIKNAVGADKLNDFLNSYSKGMIYNVISVVDDGNVNCDRDKVSWNLMMTDENDELTGQIIQGLHEDFINFEDEISYKLFLYFLSVRFIFSFNSLSSFVV